MANTGLTSTPVKPGRRKTGALLVSVPEGSSQTYPKGAAVIRSSGYIKITTGTVSSGVFGFAARSGQNGASDGAKTADIFRLEAGQTYKATLAGVWTDSLRGASASLNINSAGALILSTGTGVSASSGVTLQDCTPEFAMGDTNATVYFVPLAGLIGS